MRAIDLFSGAGGFSVAAHELTDDVLGFELDGDAVATQRAAGMNAVITDLSKVEPYDPWDRSVLGPHGHLHLHASPPCTTFSAAGRGHGRKFIDDLCRAVGRIFKGADYHEVLASLPDDIDDTSKLVLVPARWIVALEPDTISFEQVRAVMPIWDAYAEALHDHGYSAWTALLSAEQFGVPQTRVRAWLGASKDRQVEPPVPTHSKYHVRDPKRMDDGVLPWVSMAEALGWQPDAQAGFLRRADNDDTVTIDGVDYRRRDIIDADERPSLAVTEKMRSWSKFTHYAPAGVSQKSHPAQPRPLGEAPAPTVTSQANHYFYDAETVEFGRNLDDWTTERPATTVCGDPRLSGPGRNDPNVSGSQYGPNARKITVAEAAVLQGFPADFPFRGTKTSQFRQVGNAVPPPVGLAVLRGLVSDRYTEQ